MRNRGSASEGPAESSPSDPDAALGQLVAAVGRVLGGGADIEALDEACRALRRALIEARRQAAAADGWAVEASVPEVIGDNLGQLRRSAGWTQEQLGDAMAAMSFAWTRQTVAETERGVRRRASFEELFALAALFAVPAAELLRVPPGCVVHLNDSTPLSSADAQELLLGRGGRIGTGGLAWRAAASVSSAAPERPAVALSKQTGDIDGQSSRKR